MAKIILFVTNCSKKSLLIRTISPIIPLANIVLCIVPYWYANISKVRTYVNIFFLLSAVIAIASYQFGQDNNEQTRPQPPLFHRSYTHLKNQTHLQVAFGSCLNQEEDAPIFEAIKSAQPDLFLMVGDNAYADIYRDDVTRMRLAYNDLGGLLASQHLSFPIEAVWDDHDYGTNDGGRNWKHKKAAEQIFLDFWQVPPGDERRQHPGVYFQQRLKLDGAEVQIIYLDTRYFRSDLKETDSRKPGKERYVPTDDPKATMLGAAQWTWLEAHFATPADYRLLVSSVQFIAVGHGWEGWKNMPSERQRLLNLLDKYSIEDLVILSGDRHRGALYAAETDGGRRVLEITASPLNRGVLREEEDGPFRIGSTFTQNNFGVVSIDTPTGQIVLSLNDTDGLLLNQYVAQHGE